MADPWRHQGYGDFLGGGISDRGVRQAEKESSSCEKAKDNFV